MMSKIPWEKVMSLTWMDGTKLLLSALVILFVTKIQVFHDRLSALLIALPLTSLLAMIWMRAEGQDSERIANHAEGTFWFVLPTLPMFALFPVMLERWGFAVTMLLSVGVTIICFFLVAIVVRRWGVELF